MRFCQRCVNCEAGSRAFDTRSRSLEKALDIVLRLDYTRGESCRIPQLVCVCVWGGGGGGSLGWR